ncbi:Sas10/Utp3/C1D family-domain-containing protein [Flammula alnicola]|nr:Sas10/Utp3/C1D family-domain-containing protein [Flammula alnicola]
MNTETSKAKAKLAALTSSFDDLETLLEPLFAQTLPETLVGLEPLQQAKLQTVLPYLVYDLVFIYLKARGIDPKTHPVIPELDRIKQYFEKISNAENPPAKRTEIDKDAASRFIKHAIAQAKWKKTAAEEAQEDDSAQKQKTTPASVPVKVTQKMRDRAAYEKEMKERDAMESEEDELEVFEGDGGEDGSAEDGMKMEVDTNDRPTKGKGKEVASAPDNMSSNKNKRRRPAIDPFAGYGDDPVPSTSSGFKKVKSSSRSPSPQPMPQISETRSSKSSTQPATSENAKAKSKKTKKKGKKPSTTS